MEKHLPNAAETAQALANAAIALESENKARSDARQMSLDMVAKFGGEHAKGNVALMRTVNEFARMVRAGFASDTTDDARAWYAAFAKGHNAAKLGDLAGHNDALDATDADAVSLLKTFVATPVLAVTAMLPDFYAMVLAVRKDVDTDSRVSTYQSCVRVNRAVRDWAGTADELTTALGESTFHATVTAWLVPGAKAAKSVVERLNQVADSWAKVAKREKSTSLDEVVATMRGAIVSFAAELEAKVANRAEYQRVTAELAGLGLTVGGEAVH